jgi:hypothetical protein
MTEEIKMKKRVISDLREEVETAPTSLVTRAYTLPIRSVKMLRQLADLTGKPQSRVLAFLIEDAYNRYVDKYRDLLSQLEVFRT